MGNPLLSILGGNGAITGGFGNLAKIRQAMKAVQFAQNPQLALQQTLQTAIQQNPEVMQALQLCKSNNPEQVFYDLCKQKGVDPNMILSQLR